VNDPWHSLRRYTQARIALGRAGHGVTTAALLDFQLAHALARDAVHLPWDVAGFAQGVEALGLPAVVLTTAVADRTQYLQRPDLGRTLDSASRARLAAWDGPHGGIALAFSDGLSSTAMASHGLALLAAVANTLRQADLPPLGPICLLPNGRVALSDEIGALLEAQLSVIVVGERPGLSAADSLGVYLTYHPNPANSDAERNCISNIRPPDGLGYAEAAAKLAYLCGKALRLGLSGVALKDDMPAEALGNDAQLRLE
jgi:ethanolamine ammonia-lyase small subunit